MIGNTTGATPPLMPLIANRPHGPSCIAQAANTDIVLKMMITISDQCYYHANTLAVALYAEHKTSNLLHVQPLKGESVSATSSGVQHALHSPQTIIIILT